MRPEVSNYIARIEPELAELLGINPEKVLQHASDAGPTGCI